MCGNVTCTLIHSHAVEGRAMTTAHKWILKSHFAGVPKREDLDIVEETLLALGDEGTVRGYMHLAGTPHIAWGRWACCMHRHLENSMHVPGAEFVLHVTCTTM